MAKVKKNDPIVAVAVAFSTLRMISLSIGIIYPFQFPGREAMSDITLQRDDFCIKRALISPRESMRSLEKRRSK